MGTGGLVRTGGSTETGGAPGFRSGPCRSDCKGQNKICNQLTLICVQCLTDADCPGHKTCTAELSCKN